MFLCLVCSCQKSLYQPQLIYIFQLIQKWSSWDNISFFPKNLLKTTPPHPQVAGGMRLDKALLMTGAGFGAASGELAPSQGTAGYQRAGEYILPSPRHHWNSRSLSGMEGEGLLHHSLRDLFGQCLRQSCYGVWCLGLTFIKCKLIKPNCFLACPGASPCVQNERCLQQMFLLLEPVSV